MNLSVNGRIRRAIGVAFAAGVAGASVLPAQAQAQDNTTKLQGVEVTGSRIRRVDTETSNLVQVLDRKQIEATGATSMGELIQAIPSITGAAVNASANNNPVSATGGGGGFAGSTGVDIRGLGPQRTLLLLDGQRMNQKDPDAIPANMIERIEVLKAGAGAIYGTDAIGGVVNFITRKNFSGLEATAQYGETQHGDGAASGASVTWGSTGAKGSAVFGFNYNKQDAIKATDREATAFPAGVTDQLAFSSSRAPGGKFVTGTGSCASYTLITGHTGTSAADFRCFNNTHNPAVSDRFNYQPYNLDLDPTQRESIFGSGTYKFSDSVKWYGQGYYTHILAQQQLAPVPFDNGTIQAVYPLAGSPTISASNIYNPFGVDITSFAKRATAAGGRVFDHQIDELQFTTGLKGTILDRFEWDAGINYGHFDLTNINKNYLDFANVLQTIGPSYYADPNTGADVTVRTPGQAATSSVAGGIPTCGTPGNPIKNCTPLNVFGTTGVGLGSLAVAANNQSVQTETDMFLNLNGDLFNLPAGPVGAAAGFEFRKLAFTFTADALEQNYQLDESNTKSTAGGYEAREYYAELHIPVLAGLPAVKSLDFNIGGRYSDFSSFGSHTAGSYAMEYRPYNDLLVRATYADTFRAPDVTELFAGAAQSSPGYTDPCLDPTTGKATTATITGHSNACQGVVVGATQQNSQASTNVVGNPKLKPEHGYSTDFGMVFNPSFYKPLTLTADFWHYTLKDGITGISLNTVLADCYNDNTSAFCGNGPTGQPYFVRSNTGLASAPTTNIINGTLPTLNSFSFYVTGWDYAAKLSYPKTVIGGYALGNFDLGVDLTYVDQYRITNFDPGTGAVAAIYSDAGVLDPNTVVPLPRFKGLGYLFWSKGPFSASVEDRYVGNVTVGDASGAKGGDCYHKSFGQTCYSTGYANYVDVSGTYNVKAINTSFTVGITDLFDDGIQKAYSTGYAASPLSIYDVRGRSFYGKVSMRFK
ncbi:MAG: TonB-dependent receptor [Nevskia sp.]|nr:TonB-dependent receptor [Nevskia sp.]